jgi:HEAT repeat protein
MMESVLPGPRDPVQLIRDLTSGRDPRAQAAVDRLKDQQVAHFPELVSLLDSPDPDQRWWAVRALAETQLPNRSALFQRALEDPAPAVVQCALLALRAEPAPEAVTRLIPLLSRRDSLTARLAGEAVLAVGDRAVLELLRVLRGGSGRGRSEAARALARLEDPRAVPVLYELLDSDSALVTYWAEEGLTRLGVGMVFFKPGE